ncbi:MAG: aliphatic sulfonate ABC transporter substrate-binding protein [Xanthobacteraceae bacterium]|nr:aliphatic sulfonate ABC transporter substrate-binding protein [Xanthobacteraceae bacterium]
MGLAAAHRIIRVLGILALLISGASAQPSRTDLRLGFQRSSTLTALLKETGELERALAPLNLRISWHEFTSGLPLLEALNLGKLDFSADVADTVPVFAQAAGARLVYVAEEAPSPAAQAILVPNNSSIRSLADLRGKRIAVTKGAGSHYLLVVALNSVGLSFKNISPAYLTPADARAAFVGGAVDAWVAWDPFLSSAEQQSGARVVADGNGLANYKRYYLSTESFAKDPSDILQIIFDKLGQTGTWVKQNPQPAADLLAKAWGIEAPVIIQANSHRSYKVNLVTAQGLSEQQKIADVFLAEGVLPGKVNTGDVAIWHPQSEAAR